MDKRYSPYQQRKRAATRASKAAALSANCPGEAPWTQDEDEKLREGVLQHGGKKWKTIAQRFPNRTPVQCNRRWNHLQSVGTVVKKPWSSREDSEMQRLVAQYGASKWAVIASYLPGRNGKQCRERWHNQLNPAIKKGPWTEEEDEIILEMQAKYGNCWAKITEKLPGRTDNAVKNHWHSSMKAKKKKRDAAMASVTAVAAAAVAKAKASATKARGTAPKRGSRRVKRTPTKKSKKSVSSVVVASAVSPTSVEDMSRLDASGYNEWEALGLSCAADASSPSPLVDYPPADPQTPPAIAPVLAVESSAIPQGDAFCDAILAENEESLFEYESGEDPGAMDFIDDDESENDVDVVADLGVHSITPRVFDDVMSSWLSEDESSVSDASLTSSTPSSSLTSSPSCSPPPIAFSSPPFSGLGDYDVVCPVPDYYRQDYGYGPRYPVGSYCEDGVKIKPEFPDTAPSSDLIADHIKSEISPIMDSFMHLSSTTSAVFDTSSCLSALLSADDEVAENEDVEMDGDCYGGVLDAAVAEVAMDALLTV